MAKKATKKAVTTSAIRRMPRIGDRVIPPHSEAIYVVKRVSADGREVDLVMPGTTIERFRVLTDTLEFIDEPKPEAEPARPSINLDESKERIETIQRENLQRLEDDLATLMKYLESQGISTAVLDTLEALKSEQEQSWKSAVERIEKLLEEES